jgi:hypothetical protein
MLTAEPRTASVRLEHKIRDRRAVFQIPSLVLYRVVVVEFAK